MHYSGYTRDTTVLIILFAFPSLFLLIYRLLLRFPYPTHMSVGIWVYSSYRIAREIILKRGREEKGEENMREEKNVESHGE